MPSVGTGVVLGSHSVKVVQARKKGGVLKLTRVLNAKLDQAAADRPLDAPKRERLGGLMTKAGIKPSEAMMGLTGRDLIIRYTHVPPVPDWRLEMLMKFEIEEVGQQSGGEVSADWVQMDLPESSSADNTVLVALAKNTSLAPRIDTLSRGGLKLRGGCPNSVAFFHAYSSTAKLEPGEVTLLMHVGAENTDITIQKDGRMLFARNVAGGGRLFTEAVMNQFRVPYDRAEKMKRQKADVSPKSKANYADSLAEKVSNAVLGVTGQFVSMVHSSVMFCKAQTKMKELDVDRVVLAGGGANLTGFRDYLETNLGMPVVTYDPSGAVDLSGLPPEQVELVEADPTGLTVAIGLASLMLDADAMKLEILPEELKKKRRFMERDLFMVASGIALLLLLILLFVSEGSDQASAMSEFKSLQSAQRRQNEAVKDHQAALEEFDASQARWEELRDKVRVGPSLQRALALTERVIREQGFREVHLARVTSGLEPRVIEEEKESDDGRYVDPEENAKRVNLVKVEFRGMIQPLGGSATRVFTNFMSALNTEVQAHPGVTLEEGTLQSNRTFPFTIYFAPADLFADEEDDSAEEEGN